MSELDSQELDENNVFVKYLPFELNDFGLRDLFSSFGPIVSAKVMVDQKKGTSLGYGFVRFENAEDAKRATEEMSGKKIGKKKLLCKLSNLPNLTPSNLHPDTNLYVKPLLENTTEEDLKNLFLPFGEILECTILYDKETGRSRQIGFVRFSKLEEATEAMNKMNGYKFDNDSQPLVVRYAETENEKLMRKLKNSNNSSPQSPTFFVPQHILVPVQVQEGIAYTSIPPMINGFAPVGTGNIYIPPFLPPGGIPHAMSPRSANSLNSRSPRSPHSPHSPHFPVKPVIPPLVNLPQLSSQISPFSPRYSSPTTSSEPNLFVFHLPPDIDDSQLKTLFEKYGSLESAKVMLDPQTGDSKGYGFVRYKYNEDADRAISAMNGYPIGNKYLKVSFKTTSPRSPKSPSVQLPNY